MSSVIISGDTSGAITVAAPAVAGTNTLTLLAATATNSVNTLATAVASTSGTSISYTGLPNWIKRITVMFSGISTSSTNNIQVQLGSGTIDIASYGGSAMSVRAGGSSNVYNNSTGFIVCAEVAAAAVISGSVIINLLGSNTWVCNGNTADSGGAGRSTIQGGTKTLSGTLDQIRIIGSATGNPSDTFDLGTINILYEG